MRGTMRRLSSGAAAPDGPAPTHLACPGLRKAAATQSEVGMRLPARPPSSCALQVRVLRDYNDVVFSSGRVSLQVGTAPRGNPSTMQHLLHEGHGAAARLVALSAVPDQVSDRAWRASALRLQTGTHTSLTHPPPPTAPRHPRSAASPTGCPATRRTPSSWTACWSWSATAETAEQASLQAHSSACGRQAAAASLATVAAAACAGGCDACRRTLLVAAVGHCRPQLAPHFTDS